MQEEGPTEGVRGAVTNTAETMCAMGRLGREEEEEEEEDLFVFNRGTQCACG